MKTTKELEIELFHLRHNLKLTGGVATVDINAPLALIQVNLEAKIKILEWVLA